MLTFDTRTTTPAADAAKARAAWINDQEDLASAQAKKRAADRKFVKKYRQSREKIALANKIIGATGESYCTDLAAREQKTWDKNNAEWSANKKLYGEDGAEIEMPQTTPDKRFAGVYSRCKGMEKLAEEMNLLAVFITATLPPQYHSNPKNGNCSYNPDFTPDAGHRELMRRWRALGRDMTRGGQDGIEMYVRCAEPHSDGAEHLHALCYISPENFNRFRANCILNFGEVGPGLDIKIIEKTDDERSASPVSYITKYLLKAVSADFSDTDTPTDRARAWRGLWGSRGFQIGGKILNGSATTWNECRRLKLGTKRCPTLNPAAQQIFELAQGVEVKGHVVAPHDFAAFVRATGELKSAGAIELTREKRRSGTIKITGLRVDGQAINTHPTRFFHNQMPDFSACRPVKNEDQEQVKNGFEEDHLTELKAAPVLSRAVIHSYPRRAGARVPARAYIYKNLPPRPAVPGAVAAPQIWFWGSTPTATSQAAPEPLQPTASATAASFTGRSGRLTLKQFIKSITKYAS